MRLSTNFPNSAPAAAAAVGDDWSVVRQRENLFRDDTESNLGRAAIASQQIGRAAIARKIQLGRLIQRLAAFFSEQADHFAIESRNVVRLSTGDEAAIADDFFIFPVGACIFQVGL